MNPVVMFITLDPSINLTLSVLVLIHLPTHLTIHGETCSTTASPPQGYHHHHHQYPCTHPPTQPHVIDSLATLIYPSTDYCTNCTNLPTHPSSHYQSTHDPRPVPFIHSSTLQRFICRYAPTISRRLSSQVSPKETTVIPVMHR